MAEEIKPQHIVLPLKYRPMNFEDVVGQEHVVRTLRNALSIDRIANAYLFIGPRGIGKTTLSRIFAKALNCMSPNGVEPCGKCENCKQIAVGSSIDVIELDAASHNKVDDVRPIIEAVQFRPAVSKYKIFIIDECHMLTPQAWNALLKTLEEPPPYVKFIFATTEGDKLLATIVSRCQRFDLHRISTHQIVKRLQYICEKEKIHASDDALLAIARGAEGGMRDALSSLDQLIAFKGDEIVEEDALSVFGLVSRQALEDLVRAILQGDTASILCAIELFDSAGKNMRRMVSELLQHFRNLLVFSALGAKAKSLEVTEEQIKTLSVQAKMCDTSRIFSIADQFAIMEDKLRNVLSVRTLIEMTLLRASRIATTATIEELMRAVRNLRASIQNSGTTNIVTQSVAQPAQPVVQPMRQVTQTVSTAVSTPKVQSPKTQTSKVQPTLSTGGSEPNGSVLNGSTSKVSSPVPDIVAEAIVSDDMLNDEPFPTDTTEENTETSPGIANVVPPTRQVSSEERRQMMNDSKFNDFLRGLGPNSKVEGIK